MFQKEFTIKKTNKDLAVLMLGLTTVIPLSKVVQATETENHGIRLLPAPANIKIDGKMADWNLAAGVFASSNVEDLKLRDNFSLWVHGAYDAQNLYILARINDDTPLNNPGDTKLAFAWEGDSLQVRVVTDYGKASEQVSVANSWKGSDGRDVVELDTEGFTKKSPKGDDIKPLGAKQAFEVYADGKGYFQEIAIPWKLISKSGLAPKAGDTIVLTIEPNFAFGANQSRVSIKDIFRPGVPVNRVFTFMDKGLWGEAQLLPEGPVLPEPVRLSDGRRFPVTMENGVPVVNWTGLIKSKEIPGFKPIQFTLPDDGYVSLIIKNAKGEVVRHLLNAQRFEKGLHIIKWDGLGEPTWKTPNQPVDPGQYSWSGIYHRGIGLKLRGFAANSGTVPWDNGKGSNWGGDMGAPDAISTDGDRVLLGWHSSEAGKAAVLTDLNGKPIWNHKRGGFGGATAVALDNGVAYIVDETVVYKLRVADSVVVPWTENGAGETTIQELLGGDKTAPLKAASVTVKGGKLYISTAGFVAIVNAESGKLERRVELAGAGALAATSKGAYVLVNGTSLVFIDGVSGAIQTVLKTLQGAKVVATDSTGNFYIGLAAPENQVQVYSPTGKLLRTIGRKGGRAVLGPWQADGLIHISAIAIDSLNRLWVGEDTQIPMRFSVWDTKTGKLLREYFGPTRYGASGGAIHPDDPNVMIGEATEWKIDPLTGRASVVGTFDTQFHAAARFAKTGNGRDYLAVAVPAFIGGNFAETNGIKIFERLAPGQYKLRSTIFDFAARPAEGIAARTEFWADRNDDQKVQPDEIASLPARLRIGGYYLWSMYINADLTFYGGSDTGNSMQVQVGGTTPCGAPVFDVANARIVPGRGGLSSLDNKYLLTQAETPAPEWILSDLNTGQRRWSYPDLWSGVHGSHKSPPADAGLIRGAFGIVGSAKLPEPIGDVWALNTNVGEWHLLTRDGFYLSRLFQSDGMKVSFPTKAKPGADMTEAPPGLGGEDFGGSMVQGKDGKLYIQAGKTALWNTEVIGLETVQSLGTGSISIVDADTKTAQGIREVLLQAISEERRLEIKKMTVRFTGDIDTDFKDASFVSYNKGEDVTVRSTLAWDSQNLYAAWEVKDSTPWVNSADAPEYMYAHGDTVDLQLGTDNRADINRGEAVLGDLRLSIGQVAGKPSAVIFRRVATDKTPKTFSSGIERAYVMESVKTLPDANIEVKRDIPGKRYIIEASIPLTSLGIQPSAGEKLRGDMGVTHSSQSGDDTRLRTYWSNQETGIVDDEVYELIMQPKNWGEFIFKN